MTVAKAKPAAKKGGDMPMKGGHMMPGMPMKEKDMKGGKMPMKKKGY